MTEPPQVHVPGLLPRGGECRYAHIARQPPGPAAEGPLLAGKPDGGRYDLERVHLAGRTAVRDRLRPETWCSGLGGSSFEAVPMSNSPTDPAGGTSSPALSPKDPPSRTPPAAATAVPPPARSSALRPM
ncbi:hypothetical protein ABZ826_17040 [Streptomyces sp. NPDC047515]|uniref:hypothetical protein n=1 Tax=Streptomyces sp. NPDC047515 TaxID=3155380 RepID=UPI0033F4820C